MHSRLAAEVYARSASTEICGIDKECELRYSVLFSQYHFAYSGKKEVKKP